MSRGGSTFAASPPRRIVSTRALRIGIAAIGAVLFAALVVAQRDSGGGKHLATTAGSNESSRARAGADAVSSGAGASGAASITSKDLAAVKTPAVPGAGSAKAVPLVVEASSAQGLRDGDAVAIHVVPKRGSVVYGFEAFLCRGGDTYRIDADIRPSYTGKCISKPLSASSQDYVAVKASPPYSVADSTFRVGTGTDRYAMRDGRSAEVTCGPGHPCVVVLKLQFDDGYGFQTIPLTFR